MSTVPGRPKANPEVRSTEGSPVSGNLSASILARLLTLAKQRGDDYSLLLNRFALERLLRGITAVASLLQQEIV